MIDFTAAAREKLTEQVKIVLDMAANVMHRHQSTLYSTAGPSWRQEVGSAIRSIPTNGFVDAILLAFPQLAPRQDVLEGARNLWTALCAVSDPNDGVDAIAAFAAAHAAAERTRAVKMACSWANDMDLPDDVRRAAADIAAHIERTP